MKNKNSKTKIVFMGTPQFAAPFLLALIEDDDFEVTAIVTQADKPVGRKHTITPPPIKIWGMRHGLEVLQPEHLKSDKNTIDRLKEIKPDLIVVVAYGQIIPQEILDIATLGNINVHPSLLPKYRGASPIQNAVLNGDDETGVTIMLMDDKMDHGPILAQTIIKLDGQETAASLHDTFSNPACTGLLIETIKGFISGDIKPIAQDDSLATYCKMINKAEAKINWTDSAQHISAQIRGYYSWPIAWTTLDGKRVKILPPINIVDVSLKPGDLSTDNKLIIGCSDKSLEIHELQIEGKEKTTARDFILGYKNLTDKKFN
jgi:methionyl-tRNA formyltransferase